MDIIKTFIERYNGKYSEEVEKSTHTPIGKYSSQAKRGNALYKGNKIIVSINEVGGADRISELFRMKLILDNSFDAELLVFPRSYWSRKLKILLSGKNESLAKSISQQYKFSGAKELISKLMLNSKFLNKIDGEFVCINHSMKTPNIIIITPSHGYRSVEHLENLAETLTLVKSIIVDTHNTG